MRNLLILILCTGLYVCAAQDYAPNGYYVQGNHIFDSNGDMIQFKGVNRPSLEWNSKGVKLIKADIENISKTCANIVRIPLNQDFWLKNTNNYQNFVDQVVGWCMEYKLHVILDLHWSQKNDPNLTAAQQYHADEISLDFWYKLASKYKTNGKILFELYNEPHKITWDQIVNGGMHNNDTPNDPNDDWQMIGYQQLYDTVRASGAKNLIIVGGNNWTFDLSHYETNPIDGFNIMYAVHCYPFSNKLSNNWFQWTGVARKHPVFMTEFGPAALTDNKYLNELVDTMNVLGVHWTAWAWFTFNTNSMWSSFDPSTQSYVSTAYGQWVFETLAKDCPGIITSASGAKEDSESNFFPNPTNGLVHFNHETKYQLMDAFGTVLLEGKSDMLNVSDLPLGVYYLVLDNKVNKLLKQ